MKTLYKHLCACSVLAMSLTACNDFLDATPDSRINVDNEEKVQAMLATAYPQASFVRVTELASDNADDINGDLNGNYDLAYIGIGRSLLRQERYREAMDYFELKYDDENYSKAYKQYRKEWVEEHIVIIVVVVLALFLIPLSIGKVKAIKHEIDIADIFRT